ncbi:hypothetical protein CHUAL_009951 [Chamberlinius hualienensis]
MSGEPSFIDAFMPIIRMWEFFGNDVNPRGVQTFNRRMFFACIWLFHVAHSLFLGWYAVASAELNPSNFGKMVTSFSRLTVGNDDIYFKFVFFFTTKYAMTAIAKIDAILRQFNGREKAFIKKLTTVCKWFKYYPLIGVMFHLTDVINQILHPEEKKNLGSPEFLNIIDNHVYLYYLLYYLAAPLAYFQMGLVGTFIFIIMWTLMHIFDELADPTKLLPNTEARKNIKRRQMAQITNFICLHRDISDILRWVNRAFQYNLIEWLLTQMVFSLLLAREATFLVGATVPMMVTVIGIANIQILVYATVNKKAKNCLTRAIKLGLETEDGNQQALTAKVELYATHYQLDEPVLTAGGMVTFTSYLVVMFIDFVFSYNLYLRDKQSAEDQTTNAALLANKPIHHTNTHISRNIN